MFPGHIRSLTEAFKFVPKILDHAGSKIHQQTTELTKVAMLCVSSAIVLYMQEQSNLGLRYFDHETSGIQSVNKQVDNCYCD